MISYDTRLCLAEPEGWRTGHARWREGETVWMFLDCWRGPTICHQCYGRGATDLLTRCMKKNPILTMDKNTVHAYVQNIYPQYILQCMYEIPTILTQKQRLNDYNIEQYSGYVEFWGLLGSWNGSCKTFSWGEICCRLIPKKKKASHSKKVFAIRGREKCYK